MRSLTLLLALLLPSSITLAQDASPTFIADNASVLFVRLDLAKLDLEQIDLVLKSHLAAPELDRHSRKALDRARRQHGHAR